MGFNSSIDAQVHLVIKYGSSLMTSGAKWDEQVGAHFWHCSQLLRYNYHCIAALQSVSASVKNIYQPKQNINSKAPLK